MDILGLKSTIMKMKNSLQGLNSVFDWQKKESVNLKIAQQRLTSLQNRKEKNEKTKEFQTPMGHH